MVEARRLRDAGRSSTSESSDGTSVAGVEGALSLLELSEKVLLIVGDSGDLPRLVVTDILRVLEGSSGMGLLACWM